MRWSWPTGEPSLLHKFIRWNRCDGTAIYEKCVEHSPVVRSHTTRPSLPFKVERTTQKPTQIWIYITGRHPKKRAGFPSCGAVVIWHTYPCGIYRCPVPDFEIWSLRSSVVSRTRRQVTPFYPNVSCRPSPCPLSWASEYDRHVRQRYVKKALRPIFSWIFYRFGPNATPWRAICPRNSEFKADESMDFQKNNGGGLK